MTIIALVQDTDKDFNPRVNDKDYHKEALFAIEDMEQTITSTISRKTFLILKFKRTTLAQRKESDSMSLAYLYRL